MCDDDRDYRKKDVIIVDDCVDKIQCEDRGKHMVGDHVHMVECREKDEYIWLMITCIRLMSEGDVRENNFKIFLF